MAFTYSDWRRQTTSAARRERLALYIEELENALADRNLSVGSDSKNLTRESIEGLLQRAREDYNAMPQGTIAPFGKIRRQDA